jgi:hypothetical protein
MVRSALVLLIASTSSVVAQPGAPTEPQRPVEEPPVVQPVPAPQPAPPPATLPLYQGTNPPAPPPPAPPRSVMAKRWAIGVDVGPEAYEPDAPQSQKTEFGQFEVAARLRIRPPIELGLAVHLGGSKDIAMAGLYVDFRYRLMAERKLNVYALAGLGVLAVAHEEASEDARRGRGSLRLGGGVEYRFNWFALILELRLIGVGENKGLAPQAIETVDYQLSRYKLSGGSLAMGANFYF